ncbi:MAG TPA: DinB family protein, partial [Marmoricola sp.]|nr:DinB family protein [Marmoricola sp.]
MSDLKDILLDKLREARAAVVGTLDGLDEYDVRRPMTPSGTNLLGIVKHLVGNEHVYLSESFGIEAPDVLPWVADGSVWQGADMWATPEESREYILGLYDRAAAHGDQTIAGHDLDAPASVPHWAEERRSTTLGFLLVRMVEETGHHAGHADICRELIDGRGGSDHDMLDEAGWSEYLAQVQAAAD